MYSGVYTRYNRFAMHIVCKSNDPPPPPSLFFLTTPCPLFKGRCPLLNIFWGLCFGLGGGQIAPEAPMERFCRFCATLPSNA